jgi:hypothetical protein
VMHMCLTLSRILQHPQCHQVLSQHTRSDCQCLCHNCAAEQEQVECGQCKAVMSDKIQVLMCLT